MNRLHVQVTRDTLPKVKDKYPYLYLERGRMEVDDSSVKWIDCDNNVVRLPIATLGTLLLGPGTTLTHESVKVLAAANCGVCWVGEDSLIFYAAGHTPTADTRNFRRQMETACDKKEAIEVARRMFGMRFKTAELAGKTLKEMMGMEGYRVRERYEEFARKYGVGWQGRTFQPGKFMMSDITNRVLTATNAALYGILLSSIYALGYSPHIGFIHSGSPLPFVYDMADIYKERLCVDLAFWATLEMAGIYDRALVATAFRNRVIDSDLLAKIGPDIEYVLNGGKHDSRSGE